MQAAEFLDLFRQEKSYRELLKNFGCKSIEVRGCVGSMTAVVCANTARDREGVHLLVADDRDTAAYLYNDLYRLFPSGESDGERVLFFPTAWKRSIEYRKEDPAGVVQRTAVLAALEHFSSERFLIVCTYPEAILEKVADPGLLQKNTLTLHTGEKVSPDFVAESLAGAGFGKVDFVYEPGQYSWRGGIIDLFSFADNKPSRVDFFGDEVDSIRTFDIASQLSQARVERIEIVPDLRGGTGERVSLVRFMERTVGGATVWFSDPGHLLQRMGEVRVKLFNDRATRGEDLAGVEAEIVSRTALVEELGAHRVVTFHGGFPSRPAEVVAAFETVPQPAFNKEYKLLGENLMQSAEAGYRTCILTENKVQLERLESIFHSIGQKEVSFEGLPLDLHAGFTDHALQINFYTDHQIFNRYHRYTLHKQIDRSEALTIQELNALQVGDYVVHIDHGVGRFGGLVRTVEGGKTIESIKLVYRDNDVLLVNVHALHRISKYKDKEAEPPKIYKLGSGAWQKLKNATKHRVKEIARELIALYAKRKMSKGFAFSPDNYMQYELEASFMYEDTPDQQKATMAVKADMEADTPMDRLVCGDVGFGKTEVAMRAAFKAVVDGKQVAVLVPTTMLSLQHYRTFSKRFKEFPVRVELLSRAKSGKQVAEILKDLKDGKIDILIGTHKMLGKGSEFKDLGLLVIDEEQKFGVSSKERLRRMRENVDTLTLTATPIPRTLQFSLMGSRDMSVIATPPPNRQPIATEVHPFNEEIIGEAIEAEMARGGQVYFVHNRVHDISALRDKIQRIAPRARIAVGHGQMKPEELERIMMDFIYGEYDVLLATTIIESGIDISNANTMIIDNAQNFGLSDLHQLRGRVGRSNRKAFCYLLIPGAESITGDARRRLRAIEEFSDLGAGFNIAMQDLDIRGAGNVIGAEQSGFIADIGFEAYQKILDEAIRELREEQYEKTAATEIPVESSAAESGAAIAPAAFGAGTDYVADCQIETQAEAYLPDTYIGNSTEKLRLYRELDNITDEENLKKYEYRLVDRFGTPPEPVLELFNILRLRWTCIRLGFEKLIQKNGLMILHFVGNPSSAYYKTPLFAGILKTVTRNEAKFLLKQHNNRLQLTVRSIKGSGEAIDALERLLEQSAKG
ncbi:MAG: transcription-repair coupling factor [Rikenellaceae bacterium]|jgi:transcription-repair coupling factor (superfamily II helicase)|nr:transcription-repair coupling factor [Rikenellaceae bacterium]